MRSFPIRTAFFLLAAVVLLLSTARTAKGFSVGDCHPRSSYSSSSAITEATSEVGSTPNRNEGRRSALSKIVFWIGSPVFWPIVATASFTSSPQGAFAYQPDPDPLKESLYLLCRVQEATLLQERYINKQRPPIQKMKLALRLVERSYRIMDQINSVSKVIPDDDLVAAVQAGNEAAESLQDAIDFVYKYDTSKDSLASSMSSEQRDFLITALTNTRERIFDFVDRVPDQSKVLSARTRVEEENKLNQDEFDPDLTDDAGVYNPIVLPWINRNSHKQQS